MSQIIPVGLDLAKSVFQVLGADDRLGNLQLLPGHENLEKGDIPFDAWITSRSDTYRERHMISYKPDLWTARQLPEFVADRERLIRERLTKLATSALAA
ncbi:hypothetical protein [Sediminimonas qiaohouensis]|uniref:hypothetical protein n=1 Tax=Sediminimonas qiaohouensis TaxID=552061 RepID=UPI00047D2911|nr:hypothetical protein [Sediminimonas qiaohouensis]